MLSLSIDADSAITGSTARMNTRRIHREKMLRDDIFWLETRIEQLQAGTDNHDRRLAECYRRLLQQRQTQLATGRGAAGARADCWQEYFA